MAIYSSYFDFIILPYVQIFRAVQRIPSEQGQHEAFSMFLPHLAVVSLFLSTIMFASLKLPSISSPVLNLVVSSLYAAVQPFIYSMRNQDLKDALSKLNTCYFIINTATIIFTGPLGSLMNSQD